MNYTIGEMTHGFAVERIEDVPEFNTTGYVMRHKASGARLLYLQNDDTNKAFSITFKTPPVDDTGVFHILEHSVLNGSRKYPVKEPFVNLIKSSMQTFLNAMTFCDKTMYPVASTNEQDLLNLMNVYMDAVLHPSIYERPTTFQQEGWHVELREEADADNIDDADDGCQLIYNGVVYNEMKGALAEPDSVLTDALSAALFPDTAYRFESGGTPAAIPELTYEQFLDTHARHYRLDNSYIVLYGDMDSDRFLAFLDEEYLSPDANLHKDAGAPNALELQKPVLSFGNTVEMKTSAENAGMAIAYAAGSIDDRLRLYAVDILLDAIASSNESPLKKALLEAKLGCDAVVMLNDDILQPFVIAQIKGLAPGAEERFRDVLETEVARLAGGGLDHELVEAALSHAEIVLRERNFGIADGVACAISCLSGWLYNDALSTAFLRYEDIFAKMRDLLEEGYFEQLLREVFLEPTHAADAHLIPVEVEPPSAATLRLQEQSRTLTPEQRDEIKKATAHLRAVQNRPDTPEELATLPHLGIADLGDAPAETRPTLQDTPFGPVLRHHVTTNGISYATRYYDISGFSADDVMYLSLLTNLLGRLDTAWNTAADLNKLAMSKLGNLTFSVKVFSSDHDASICWPKFIVDASSLASNTSQMAKLSNEVCLATRFDDYDRILNLLVQRKHAMELGFANNGNKHASARAQAKVSEAAALRQLLGGVDHYRFLCDLIENYEERKVALSERLSRLCATVFREVDCLTSFTGEDDDLLQYMKVSSHSTRRLLQEVELAEPVELPGLIAPPIPAEPEAFTIPTDITFTAVAFDTFKVRDTIPFSGSWLLACQALTYDYLWDEVRVKGGAYGVSFLLPRTDVARCASFRDPHLDETIERFQNAADWLSTFDPSPQDWEGYVVSVVAGIDAPMKTRALIRRQNNQFIAGIDPALRQRNRAEVVASTPEDLRKLAPLVRMVTTQGALCTFGSREVIETSQIPWKVESIV